MKHISKDRLTELIRHSLDQQEAALRAGDVEVVRAFSSATAIRIHEYLIAQRGAAGRAS